MWTRSFFFAVVVLVMIGVGCSGGRDGDPARSHQGEGACAEHVAQYASTLAARDDACASDAECACYQGGVGPAAGCGGVTGAETAAALDAILARFRSAGCDDTQQCAPWACAPRCVEGTCAQ